jgi:pimeloyl-ACP methyl ester carboxylesterase
MFFLFPSELTVRTESSGGDLAPQVTCGSTLGLSGRSRVVLLCHGYANSVDAARQSYGTFVQNFISQFPMAASLKTDVFQFYWPGDEPYPGVSQLSYPIQIRSARNSAQCLAKYLVTLPVPTTGEIEIYVIAHSLGNRVALELLNALRAVVGGGPTRFNFRGILMMAAAVPVNKVGIGGSLHDPALMMARQFVLHSTSDWVLKFAFPPGETAAGDGLFPQAVGRYGNPDQWTNSKDMPGYGHSDYWPKPETSDMVARFMGYVAPNAVQRSYIPAYMPAPPNKVSENTIPDHSPGGSP